MIIEKGIMKQQRTIYPCRILKLFADSGNNEIVFRRKLKKEGYSEEPRHLLAFATEYIRPPIFSASNLLDGCTNAIALVPGGSCRDATAADVQADLMKALVLQCRIPSSLSGTVEINGEPGAGKSEYCYRTAAEFLRHKKKVLWVDGDSKFEIRRLVSALNGCPTETESQLCNIDIIRINDKKRITSLSEFLTQAQMVAASETAVEAISEPKLENNNTSWSHRRWNLIVIDPVTSLVREELARRFYEATTENISNNNCNSRFSRKELRHMTKSLCELFAVARRVADVVVFTNHVAPVFLDECSRANCINQCVVDSTGAVPSLINTLEKSIPSSTQCEILAPAIHDAFLDTTDTRFCILKKYSANATSVKQYILLDKCNGSTTIPALLLGPVLYV